MKAILKNLKTFTEEGDEIMVSFMCILLGYNAERYIEAAKTAKVWGTKSL